jgi:hypothetical protein
MSHVHVHEQSFSTDSLSGSSIDRRNQEIEIGIGILFLTVVSPELPIHRDDVYAGLLRYSSCPELMSCFSLFSVLREMESDKHRSWSSVHCVLQFGIVVGSAL